MAVTVKDPFLNVTINSTGATHYRVNTSQVMDGIDYVRLPTPEVNGSFIVPYNLPNVPGSYNVSVQLKNSLHESAVLSSSIILLGDVIETVSVHHNKLRIAQLYGNNVTPDTIPDGIKCIYCWMSLYNAGTEAIDLSTVAVWTRYENCTSTLDSVTGTYVNVPTGVKSAWVKVPLSGTIQPGKYFLIKGKRPTTIVLEETLVPCIDFTTFVPDLDLSASLFISSKMQNVILVDSSVTEIPADPYANGVCTTGFIDLFGSTNVETDGSETYSNPTAYIINYSTKSSKQQVRTIVNPTIEAADNSLDYTATSIKSITTTTILTSLAKPRNSTYAPA